MSTKHSQNAEKFLENEEHSRWHYQSIAFVREKRDRVAMQVPEWEALRSLGSQIKEHTVSNLDKYITMFAEKAQKNGAVIHWAKDEKEHNDIVLSILKKHNCKKLAKSKSMLTEECHLNPFLIKNGIDVVETDLGERILQFMDAPPSHIVMPAIHLKRQEVGKLFEEKINTEKGNCDPTYLTHAARGHLRNEFLTADVGMTGGNFGIAETGEVVVCTNEGNADMGVSLPKVHIVSMGIEKLVPNYQSLGVFTRLLARSATGQPITTYTTHFKRPQDNGELHIVLVDSGRSDIIGNVDHNKTLNCIRCAACMNTCPVYRRSGGYTYTYFIPGPIGINLGMLKNPKKYHDNVSACSLCFSCNNVCPVKIDLGNQIYRWRQKLDSFGVASETKKSISSKMSWLFTNPSMFNASLTFAPMFNYVPNGLKVMTMREWMVGRNAPTMAKESFTSLWKKGKVK